MGKAANKEKILTRDFVLIVALNFLLFMAFQLFPSALPVYAASIGVPNSYLGLISGLLTLSALIARPLAGAAADRFGRKGILFAGLAVMTVCTAAYAFCPLFVPLLVIRFIQGLGWGSATTASNTIVSDILPHSRFGEGMGYFGLSVSVALAIGPAMGLALLDAFGITVLSLIGTGCLIATLILGALVKRRSVAAPSPNQALSHQDTHNHLDDKQTCSSKKFSANNVQSMPDKIAPPREKAALLEKGAAASAITMFFMTCTYGTIVTYLALMGAERGIEGVAMFFVVYAVAAIISRPLIGRFIDKNGFTLATGVGIVLMLAGLIAITLAWQLALLVVAGALFGFGQGILQTTLQTKAVVDSPANRRGAATATFYVGFDGGIGAGSLIGGALVGVFGYTGMFALMCALPVFAFITFLYFEKRNESL